MPMMEFVSPDEIERAKASGIVKRHAAALGGLNDEMIMLVGFRWIYPPPAGHTEMKDQSVTAVRIDEPVFGAPPEAGDHCSGEPLAKIFGHSAPQVGSTGS